MKIGLISDTHAPAMGAEPPVQVWKAFEGVELILHAGDIYTSECLDALERIAPVIAVEVPPAPVIGDSRVMERRVIALEGHSIGLVHDLALRGIDEVQPGGLATRFGGDRSLPDVVADFFGEPVDIVVFGHTHYAMAERHQGLLFVNPGSPTLPRQVRRLGSVGILELTATGASAQIVELSTIEP